MLVDQLQLATRTQLSAEGLKLYTRASLVLTTVNLTQSQLFTIIILKATTTDDLLQSCVF